MRILIGSNNEKKAREMSSILAGMGIQVVTIGQAAPGIESPEEHGSTFEENAGIKALYYANSTSMLCVADDSGLEVAALGGAPGVYSSRYAGTEGDDAANNAKLLHEMNEVPDNARHARFRTAICLASPGDVHFIVGGSVEGKILRELRGEGGFGYDPLFFHEGFQKSFGELSAEEKATVSHRGEALREFAIHLPEALTIIRNRTNF